MQTELLFDPTAFRSHDWSDLVAADPAGTFFHTPAYLKLWWEELGGGRLVVASVADRDRQVGACAFQVEEGLLAFLGGFEVTDYMGPVALAGSEEAVARELMDALSGEVEWERADFRGLREGSAWARALEGAAMSQGMAVSREQDGGSPVLELPPSYEEYLAGLPPKLRHEIRRKQRRLREQFGDYSVEFATEETLPAFFDRFIELHKQSPGPKGKFMHAGMEIFFRRLGEAFIRSHVFHLGFIEIEETKAAGFIGFAFKDGFSLYNSAFDRDFGPWSPGMVLIAEMIRRAIQDGRHTFDFLKGDLDYKHRFGPTPMPFVKLLVRR